MGSDEHYPEEAPAHSVAVDGFWIEPSPVTNARFAAFVDGDRVRHRRRAAARPRRLPRRAGREPRARLDGLHQDAGAGRPAPPQPVVGMDAGRLLAAPGRALDRRWTAAATIRSCTSPTRTPRRTPRGPGSHCRPRPSGSTPPAAALDRVRVHLGRRARGAGRAPGELLARRLPLAPAARIRDDGAGRLVSPERLRPLRHGRQRLGVDDRLVQRAPPRGRGQAVLRAAQPARRR